MLNDINFLYKKVPIVQAKSFGNSFKTFYKLPVILSLFIIEN